MHRLRHLIHNAATAWFGEPQRQTQESIALLVAVNRSAPMSVTHSLGTGHAASKDGLASYARSLRVTLRAQGVGVLTVRAAERRRSILIPGAGNQLFAALGHVLPRVTDRAMKQAILG